MSIGYPFSAVVGLDDLKLALLLNAVAPDIGGVLVRGEKGTAKSTAVRALAALLPPVRVVAGCRFACDPDSADPRCPDGPHGAAEALLRPARLVELPVGATEDRLVGSLDLERALSDGVRSFEPGLLAAAHRGVLYVDEVNLLHDHLVDLLLDAAAMGTNYVEREGVSVAHPARFLLVGTMNPEEGELRPQLQDRFGLVVDVRASRDPAQRAEVVRRRLGYEADTVGFAARHAADESALAQRIVTARSRVAGVQLPDAALHQISTVCAAFGVDGLRADVVTARSAVAYAAWCGDSTVGAEHVRVAARLALPHRRRRDPFDEPGAVDEQLEAALDQATGDAPGATPDAPGDDDPPGPGGGGGGAAPPRDRTDAGPEGPDGAGAPDGATAADGGGAAPDRRAAKPVPTGTRAEGRGGERPAEQPVADAASGYRAAALALPGVGRDGPAGRRGRTEGDAGRTVAARAPDGRLRDVHLAATLRAAAPHQRARGRSGPGVLLRRDDLREPVREGREGSLVLFCVDASGSMAAQQRMRDAKGAVLALLRDAYQRRDKVGMVVFRRADATVLLPPTSSVELASARLRALPTGGRTPLAAGLHLAGRVLAAERVRDPRRRPLLVLVTDGRHTAGPDPLGAARRLAARGVPGIVVDCEQGAVRLGLAGRLADALGAPTVQLDSLGTGVGRAGLADVVRAARRAA